MSSSSNKNFNSKKDAPIGLFRIIIISLFVALIFGVFSFLLFEWVIASNIIREEESTFFFAIFSGIIFYFLCVFMGIVFGRTLYRQNSSKSINSFKTFTDKLHKEADLHHIYQSLQGYLQKLFKKSKVNIYYKDVDNFKKISWLNYPKDSTPICTISHKTCPVIVNKKECFVSDIQTDITCAYQMPFFTNGCYICLLVKINNNPYAVVQLFSKHKYSFDSDIVQDIKSYLEVIEPIVQSQTQLNDLSTEVYTDKLTGTKNRTFLESQIDKLIKLADKNNEQFGLIIIDLDHFKKINDTYGHPAGDCILIEFSQIVTSCLRGNDIVARYGGEEFIILLPKSNMHYSTTIAERIRYSIASATMPTFEGAVLPPLTCSLGVSAYPSYASNKAQLIKTADKALYFAKENGRNQVMAYDPYKLEPS